MYFLNKLELSQGYSHYKLTFQGFPKWETKGTTSARGLESPECLTYALAHDVAIPRKNDYASRTCEATEGKKRETTAPRLLSLVYEALQHPPLTPFSFFVPNHQYLPLT